jgi:hypothetical protein
MKKLYLTSLLFEGEAQDRLFDKREDAEKHCLDLVKKSMKDKLNDTIELSEITFNANADFTEQGFYDGTFEDYDLETIMTIEITI